MKTFIDSVCLFGPPLAMAVCFVFLEVRRERRLKKVKTFRGESRELKYPVEGPGKEDGHK